MNGEGFVPWTPFDHPQLGDVEIGAGNPSSPSRTRRPHLLEAECEKLCRFAIAHAKTSPRLQAALKAEEPAPGVRRIELTVENTGFLPTNVTTIAADKKLVKPVGVTVGLPEGAELVSGERETDLGHLAGRSTLLGNRWKTPTFFNGLHQTTPAAWCGS